MEQALHRYAQAYKELAKSVGDSAAIVILQEVARDNRCAMMREERSAATDRQKLKLKKLGISYDENITKSEASARIDAAQQTR